MRRIGYELFRLLESNAPRGYIDLIRPLTFDEQVEETRLIRDMEEAGEALKSSTERALNG